MKKTILSVAIFTAVYFISCSGDKDSPESVAKKWCELNEKVKNATDDEAREKAREERENYEQDIEKKYPQDDEKNKEFWDKVMQETEKCE
jgi:hypothetical protein